jgi:hypothetical protein
VRSIYNGPDEVKGEHHANTIHIAANDFDAAEHAACCRAIAERQAVIQKCGRRRTGLVLPV